MIQHPQQNFASGLLSLSHFGQFTLARSIIGAAEIPATVLDLYNLLPQSPKNALAGVTTAPQSEQKAAIDSSLTTTPWTFCAGFALGETTGVGVLAVALATPSALPCEPPE